MQRSPSRLGLTDAEWEAAVQELRAAIIGAARDRRMTSYGEVAPKITVAAVDPHSSLLSHLLGEVFRREHEAGRPALTAIVTHKHGDKEPGGGFYEMARKLGIQFGEPYIYWSTSVQDVFKEFGTPSRAERRRAQRAE